MIQRAGWYLMMVAAAGVSAYALALSFSASLRGDFVVNMFVQTPLSAVFHFVGGAIVLVAGASQFHRGLRSRHPQWHRWLGRVYLAGVLIGGISGLYLAFHAYGGLVSQVGFGLLAVGWLFTTALAFGHILRRNIVQHQRWMIRSYALTLAAVTLRIYLPLFIIAGLPFDQAYPTIAWLAWVPNLIIAEWVFVAMLDKTSRT